VNVVCAGDCGIDYYLPGGERLIGGITLNVARHARDQFRSSDRISIASCVGMDDDGERILVALRDAGVECHVVRLGGTTPVQTIEIAANGERQFVHYDEGVLRDHRFTDEQRQVIVASDLLVAPVFVQIIDWFDRLMSIPLHGHVAIDFADFREHPDFDLLRGYLDRIDIAFFGLGSADEPVIDRLRRFADQTGKLFVVTLGAEGSIAFEGSRMHRCPAAPATRVVDTTGAGDAYAAAFLGRYCSGDDVPRAMEHASALAAEIVARIGTYRR